MHVVDSRLGVGDFLVNSDLIAVEKRLADIPFSVQRPWWQESWQCCVREVVGGFAQVASGAVELLERQYFAFSLLNRIATKL